MPVSPPVLLSAVRRARSGLVLGALLLNGCESPGARSTAASQHFASRPDAVPDGPWIGPDYWANRLQDWRRADGRIECVGTRLPWRTLHLLTGRSGEGPGSLRLSARLGPFVHDTSQVSLQSAGGFLIGAGAADLDPRSACLVQSTTGPDGGWRAGIDSHGRLFLESGSDPERRMRSYPVAFPGAEGVRIEAVVAPTSPGFSSLSIGLVGENGEAVHRPVQVDDIPDEELAGNVALLCHPGEREKASGWWFEDWRIEGSRFESAPERALGPIVSTLHTLSRGVLKMTVQLMPVADAPPEPVVLERRDGSRWRELARAAIVVPGHTAHFRLEDWNTRADVPYRVRYGGQSYEGTIRREPLAKDELVLGALSCNHNNRHGFGRAGYPWNEEALWFPHQDLVDHLELQSPDVLFFGGDQIYEGASPTPPDRGADRDLDYLYKWVLWCWAYRDLTRDLPTVVLPDDHDVYQGNLWGQGGRKTDRDHNGGYVMPADWVRMIERTQTSHLPDPWFEGTIEQGIGTCYTDMLYGGVSFAILEDRKFKSGPNGLIEHDGPRPDHIVDPDFDRSSADVPGAVLLGADQLAFLREWAADWEGAACKIALSQTIFANVATDHGPNGQRLVADLDSNGWPQSGRNRALHELRRGFALMVAGDQHLSTVVHHGIEDWSDAGVSFCVPATANFYPRAWLPEEPGADPVPGFESYTGNFLDGLGNRIRVLAATNPGASTGWEPAGLHDKMPGYGIVRVRKGDGSTVLESWPRGADPRRDAPYAGWPVELPLTAQYGREPTHWLPEVVVESGRPVVQVVEEASDEIVYTLRAPSSRFRPFVFAPGRYTVRVDGVAAEGLEASASRATGTLQLE